MISENLSAAFSKLRDMGYFAEEDFWCCQSCGWADVPEDATNVVFYHHQDAENLIESGSCCLAWAGNADEIISVLNSFGIETEWNGSENTRITIRL